MVRVAPAFVLLVGCASAVSPAMSLDAAHDAGPEGAATDAPPLPPCDPGHFGATWRPPPAHRVVGAAPR